MDAKTFLAEFGHIVNAPGGIERLREMIYQLAITGRLVDQIQSEGSGISLLEEIQAKKKLLITQKKFKRSPKLDKLPKPKPEIKIPKTWVFTYLVDIGEISPKNIAEDACLVSFLPMSGVSDKHLGQLITEGRGWEAVKKGYTHIADGDIALAKITPCFENGKAAVIDGLENSIGAGTTELYPS